MLKHVLKARKGKIKAAYFQPLTQLELIVRHNTKGNLNFIKEVKISNPYATIAFSIVKQTIVIFLSEVLTKSLKEEERNTQLFEYLETSLTWFDTHDSISNFHLLFLVNLTKHLGFYPEKENSDYPFFNLNEGRFSSSIPKQNRISEENVTNLKVLFKTNFDELEKLQFNASVRQAVLEILIDYYILHLPGFSKPKSLSVLKTVFS